MGCWIPDFNLEVFWGKPIPQFGILDNEIISRSSSKRNVYRKFADPRTSYIILHHLLNWSWFCMIHPLNSVDDYPPWNKKNDIAPENGRYTMDPFGKNLLQKKPHFLGAFAVRFREGKMLKSDPRWSPITGLDTFILQEHQGMLPTTGWITSTDACTKNHWIQWRSLTPSRLRRWVPSS